MVDMLTSTYTLEVPATKESIMELMETILHNFNLQTAPDIENCETRVQLKFGTSALLCQNEREREEFRDKVTIREAIGTLLAAFNGCLE